MHSFLLNLLKMETKNANAALDLIGWVGAASAVWDCIIDLQHLIVNLELTKLYSVSFTMLMTLARMFMISSHH